MNVNKVLSQLLFSARNTVLKEASKTHRTSTNLTIQDKPKNDTRLNFKSHTKRKNAVLRTVSIQKKTRLQQQKQMESKPYKYINKYISLLSEKEDYERENYI